MLLKAYRIVHNRYVRRAFDGEGASKYGGRWNSKGTPVIYTSESISLATLEILVHLEDASVLTKNFSYIEIQFDEKLVDLLDESKMTKNWYKNPPNKITQMIGDNWVENNSSAVLRVPSSVIKEEYNYIVNPNHKDYSKIIIFKARKLILDERITDKIQ